MNEKERIKRCIHFEATDVTPWQINYTTEMGDRLMVALGLEHKSYCVLDKNVSKYDCLDEYFGNHIVYVRNRAVNSLEEVSPGLWRDEWGVTWDRRIDKDIGNPVNHPLETGKIEDLEIPDPSDPDRYAHFQPLIEANPDRYVLAKFSYNLFERAWSLRGMERFLVDMMQDPAFAHELLERICKFNLTILENLKKYPIDGVYFADDWGTQRGLLFSPDTWRRFIKPYLEILFAQAHRQGYDVFIHCCGDVSALLEDLIEIGLDVFNPFQPEVMDIECVIETYARRLAFYGGISIQRTLPFGTTQAVKKEIEIRLRLNRLYGGMILSPSHDMPPDIPLDNIYAMVEAIKGQCV